MLSYKNFTKCDLSIIDTKKSELRPVTRKLFGCFLLISKVRTTITINFFLFHWLSMRALLTIVRYNQHFYFRVHCGTRCKAVCASVHQCARNILFRVTGTFRLTQRKSIMVPGKCPLSFRPAALADLLAKFDHWRRENYFCAYVDPLIVVSVATVFPLTPVSLFASCRLCLRSAGFNSVAFCRARTCRLLAQEAVKPRSCVLLTPDQSQWWPSRRRLGSQDK